MGQRNMLNSFSNYFFLLNNAEQENIIYHNTMVSLMVNSWNDDICAFLCKSLTNCSQKMNPTVLSENYLYFPKLMKQKQINSDSIQKIYKQIWNNITLKLDLFGNGSPFKALSCCDILNIYAYILWNDFDKELQSNQLKMFYNAYIQYVDQQKQKIVCSEINITLSAKPLIELRISYLTNKINASGAPSVNYTFPNLNNQNEAQFRQFLNSDNINWSKGGFTSIVQARKWAKLYSKSEYSFSAIPQGRGRSACVKVTKNQSLQTYYKKNSIYKEDVRELKLLQSQIDSLS